MTRKTYLLVCCYFLLLMFAGAFAPPARASEVVWRMIVVPDTQYYQRPENTHIFHYMTRWMVDNKDAMNIGLVLNLGDIVDLPLDTLQWERAKSAISTLDGELPYAFIPGNHDYRYSLPRDTRMNEFFSASDNPLNDPAQGGIYRAPSSRGPWRTATTSSTRRTAGTC